VRQVRLKRIAEAAKAQRLVMRDTALSDFLEESMTVGIDNRLMELLLTHLVKNQPVTSRQLLEEIGNLKEQGQERIRRSMRRRLMLQLLRNRGLKFDDPPRSAILSSLAEQTEGYVGADLEAVCREAGIFALREGVASVQLRHIEEARKKVHPTMNERLREVFARYQESFKAGLARQEQPREYQ
jgi:transitional endoplasmic reticulum ATPase